MQVQPCSFQNMKTRCDACRYLTDHMESLPLGIMSRIVTVNDSVLALVPLLEKQPWKRRHVRRSIIPMDETLVPVNMSDE